MYTYKTFTEVTDLGPYITKLILDAPVAVRAECVSPETFSVYVQRIDPYTGDVFMGSREWLGPKIYPSRGYRPVTAAYPCDEAGNKVYESDHIALEMPYGPIHPLGQAIAMLRSNFNEYVRCDYRVTQVKEIPGQIPISGWVFDEAAGDICPQMKGWQNGFFQDKKVPMGYGWFTPEKADPEAKLPLVIWLHGMGEGGKDATIAYTGNKTVNISAPAIQRKLGGAAYVLAPQAPSFWMDSGAKNPLDPKEFANSKSKYTKPLKALIDEFIKLHPDVDTKRIYIGGCSNGGFMTMRMILSYPNFFAAAYPVCEAFQDRDISDADIEKIKHIPIWFTHAENDPLVPGDATAIATVKRLRAAGAENAHLSLFESVVDTSGLFNDERGCPYTYMAHFSWIYTYNDECIYDLDGTRVMHEGRPVSLWRWMGCQKKK